MATMDEWDSLTPPKKQNVASPKVVNRPHSTIEVHECFEPHLRRVLQTKKFGITLGSIELKNISSSCGSEKGDRFKICIPYANQQLDWTVMFNSAQPEMGPDFEFSDKSFLADPVIEHLEESVPSWFTWKHVEHDGLLRVLTELVLHYKQHQIAQLNQFGERLSVEYTTLVDQTEICHEDVELILLPDCTQPEEAHFLIRIAMDFSRLPGKRSVNDHDAAMLHVTFYGPHWNRITPQLYFSKSLEDILGSPSSLHLPPFLQDKCLMDYVPEVKGFIADKINSVIGTFEKKRNFITTVLYLQRCSIIEYDSVEFSYVTFMLAHRDFHVLVSINLPPAFPQHPPKITLQSIYHMTPKNELYEQVLPRDKIPYSPRWEPAMMFTKALAFIIETEINKFKNNSTQKIRR